MGSSHGPHGLFLEREREGEQCPGESLILLLSPSSQARVNVPDDRFKWLCNLYKPKSEVPAFLEICDIAGLVKGAAQGEGLGNAFLSHIMAVDGIFHVCRAFEDSDIVHVEDRVDPVEGTVDDFSYLNFTSISLDYLV